MKEAISKLLSLQGILRRIGITSKYCTPKDLKELVVLSDAGKLMSEEMKKRLPEVDENSLYFGLLLDLYHKEFWIDPDKTDVDKLLAVFDNMAATGAFQIPWVFGRDLYDRYFRLFTGRIDKLDEVETQDLLEGTPCGVAQVGSVLIGPLGIVKNAMEFRSIFPKRRAPLWHCSDLGCEHLHTVTLELTYIPELEVAGDINSAAVELLGEGVDWSDKFSQTYPYKMHFYQDQGVYDIVELLTECLSGNELKTLCSQLLTDYSEIIRSSIVPQGQIKSLFKNSSAVIASKLGRDQCLQMILVLEDKAIVDTLEKIIFKNQIRIPPYEVRRARLGEHSPAPWLNMYSELSQFGFRRVSGSVQDVTIAIARLKNLVEGFYQGHDISKETLSHLLRYQTGSTISQKLDHYIRNSDPKAVLSDLIAIHHNGLPDCITYLKYGFTPPLNNKEDEEALIDKILWKLGFSVRRHSPIYQIFDTRLDLLLGSARGITNTSEADREKTRSAAVNLFVSLEEILDLTLSYASWIFLSDHFEATRFEFKLEDGRKLASKYLNGRKVGSEKLQIKSDGKNTLFPLIEGLSELAKLIREVKKKGAKKHQRPETDMPGYVGKTELESFPFKHTMFLLDMRESDLASCIDCLNQASHILKTGKVCEIRNRLEHKREDFPSRDEVETCCDAISKAIKRLSGDGLCPVDYYRTSVISDSYSREQSTYTNYANHSIVIKSEPSHFVSYPFAGQGPIAIAPIISIGDSTDVFYARLLEASEYTEMWKDYPKRRSHEEESDDMTYLVAAAGNEPSVLPEKSTLKDD